MTAIDVGIIVITVALALGGWRQGFLVGACSLGGFAAGAFLGSRIAAALTSQGSSSPYAPLYGLIGAVALGGFLAIVLETVGSVVRESIRRGSTLAVADGVGGTVLLALLALGLCWLVANVALQTPGTSRKLRADIQRSSVLRRLNDILPPSGGLLNALARFDPLQAINGPPANVEAPPTGIGRRPSIRAAAAGVVRVTGTACGLGIEGSGWVVAPNTVVTNAHVVAGETDTAVQVRGKGPKLSATAVGFDPTNDVALLHVGGLDGVKVLPLADKAPRGRPGAVLGFPRNGPYDVRAARLGLTGPSLGQNAYGEGPVKRDITALRAYVRPGNSGGPVVDVRGHVLATIFAASRDQTPRAGYAVPNKFVERLRADQHGKVSTGPCAP